ncbi:MAG: hypothetical protein Q4G09_00925 [Clostridia bacterium]|nr:hypothetical protein [Clostridia bacterium]
MKLISLKLKGFRKYKDELLVNFSNETYITGGNFKGKTTIAMAIVFGFLGTNLRGNEKECLINRDSKDCYVELSFEDNNGELHNLIRYKHKTSSKDNFISLDGKIVKQADLINFYHDKPLFLAIFNPDYFRDFEPAKQRELIDKYLPNIPFDTILNTLSEDEKKKITVKHNNIRLFIKDTEKEIKEIQNDILLRQGKIEYATKLASEDVMKEKTFDKTDEVSLLEQELDFIKKNNKFEDKEKLQKQIGEKQAEELNLENKLDKIKDKGSRLRASYNSLQNDTTSLCPTCRQPLNIVSKQVALNEKRKEMFELADEKSSYEEQIKNIKFEITKLKMNFYALGASPNVSENARIDEVLAQIETLKNEQQDILNYNNEVLLKNKSIEQAKSDVSAIQKEISLLEAEIQNLKIQADIGRKLYCANIQEKMKIADQYMPNARIKFYELIKSTGELKDCFVITRNGEEFSDLSRSLKFVTMLELCNMLNKISGLNIPLLIDDSESYTDFDFRYEDYNTQLIIIRALKGRTLRVSKQEEKLKLPTSLITKKYNLNKKQYVCVA